MTAQAYGAAGLFIVGIALQILLTTKAKFSKKDLLKIGIGIISGIAYYLMTVSASFAIAQPAPTEIIPSILIGSFVISVLLLPKLLPTINEVAFVVWTACAWSLFFFDDDFYTITFGFVLFAALSIASLIVVIANIHLHRYVQFLLYGWFIFVAISTGISLGLISEASNGYQITVFNDAFSSLDHLNTTTHILSGMVFFYFSTYIWFFIVSFFALTLSQHLDTSRLFQGKSLSIMVDEKYSDHQSHPIRLLLIFIATCALLYVNSLSDFIDSVTLIALLIGLTPLSSLFFPDKVQITKPKPPNTYKFSV